MAPSSSPRLSLALAHLNLNSAAGDLPDAHKTPLRTRYNSTRRPWLNAAWRPTADPNTRSNRAKHKFKNNANQRPPSLVSCDSSDESSGYGRSCGLVDRPPPPPPPSARLIERRRPQVCARAKPAPPTGATTAITRTTRRHVYSYKTDWPISSVDWSHKPSERLTVALASLTEAGGQNYISVVSLARDHQRQQLRRALTFEHPYPASRVLWMPRPEQLGLGAAGSLLATSADCVRVWRVDELQAARATAAVARRASSLVGPQNCHKLSESRYNSLKLRPECVLADCRRGPSPPGASSSARAAHYCAPLAAFDWNAADARLLVTASLDATCALWDLEYERVLVEYAGDRSPSIAVSVEPQVSGLLACRAFAHEHQVYDVSFSALGSGRDAFVSCSADRSVRLTDVRRPAHSGALHNDHASSVLLESLNASGTAFVRVACAKRDPNLVAAFALDSTELALLDVRRPGRPVCALVGHLGPLNAATWAPHSPTHLASAADDRQALVWDLGAGGGVGPQGQRFAEPLLAHGARGPVNSISWSAVHSDWLAIAHGRQLDLLRAPPTNSYTHSH